MKIKIIIGIILIILGVILSILRINIFGLGDAIFGDYSILIGYPLAIIGVMLLFSTVGGILLLAGEIAVIISDLNTNNTAGNAMLIVMAFLLFIVGIIYGTIEIITRLVKWSSYRDKQIESVKIKKLNRNLLVSLGLYVSLILPILFISISMYLLPPFLYVGASDALPMILVFASLILLVLSPILGIVFVCRSIKFRESRWMGITLLVIGMLILIINLLLLATFTPGGLNINIMGFRVMAG